MSSTLYNYPLTQIKELSISVYSAEELETRSHVSVTNPNTYDDRGILVEGGVLDSRMGVCNANQRCTTCGADYLNCRGHVGSIELPFPLYHSELIDITFFCLSLICPSCAHIQPLLKYIKKIAPVCVNCKLNLPVYSLQKPTTILADGLPITAETVQNLFLKINLNELKQMHPRLRYYNPLNGILNTLAVGSVTIRPSLILDSNRTAEDDITHKYADITRTIVKYKKTNPFTLLESTKQHFINLLQYHVTTLFNNSTSGIPAAQLRSGKPIVGLIERLKGKEGRFRKHLAGKRINFAARAVITPSIYIAIDEVGLPRAIANTITKPMYVSRYLLDKILEIYDADPEGVVITYIVVEQKKLKVLAANKELLRERIVPGTMIYRTLMNGDTVLLNRNPTLQQQSLLAHRVKIVETNTIVLHPSTCYGSNADFDGDEMNLHVIQEPAAEIEAKMLLGVSKNIVLLKTGKSVLGATKDIIVGLYCLTKYDDVFSAFELSSLIMSLDLAQPVRGTLTGRALFSKILPPKLSVEFIVGTNHVVIENSIFKKGYLGKPIIGPEGLLPNTIYSRYGTEVFIKFMHNLMLLGANIAEHYGFTYGLRDIAELPRLTVPDTPQVLDTVIKELEKRFLETASETHTRSCAYAIAESGAAGNKLSLVQNALYTGYQNEKTDEKFSNMNFTKHRLLLKSFIKNSFIDGLDSYEYYTAAITARSALIDLFVKTASVGYAARKIMNALEDFTVRKDKTIRNTSGRILYLRYSNDGLDRTKISETVPWVDLSAYHVPNTHARFVKTTEVRQAMAMINETHLVQLYPALFLEGCITYLLANNYSVDTLLTTPLVKLYQSYCLSPGSPIGLITGQCFAEPITQVSLNTKHNIGDTTLSSALDSILEALYASKKLKLPFIKLTCSIDDRLAIEKFARTVYDLKLSSIATLEIDYGKAVYNIKLDPAKLKEYGVTMDDVLKNMNELWKIKECTDLSLTFDLPPNYTYSQIYTIHTNLLNLTIKGLAGTRCETFIKGKTMELFIYNTGLKTVYKLLKLVSFDYTFRTNQYYALEKLFGILTLKHYLAIEVKEIFMSQGLTLSNTHIDFIVRVMTLTGTFKGLSRSGVVADKASFLAKAGFETANKVLIKAAILNTTDRLKGLYENTIIGRFINAGTTTNLIHL